MPERKTFALDKKVAVVTGAAQGIGRAIARRLFQDGARLVILDVDLDGARRTAKECCDGARTALALRCDVTIRSSVFSAVEEVVRELGGIDIMVANAGICEVRPFLEISDDDWDRLHAVNVKGVLFCFQAAAKRMIDAGRGGRLIAASSIAGHQGYPTVAHYCASKFAVRAIVQSAARELAPFGITVNAYCPGVVGTALWEKVDRQMAEISGAPVGASFQQFAQMAALGRPETPEDIAGLVAFLASEDSAFMTGQAPLIDGGIVFV